jgi:hypothetical protein
MLRFTNKITEGLPLLAIDLGYSATQASCGIATHEGVSKSLQFGDAIAWTAAYLNQNEPHILIIEAVLSTYHRLDGNPTIRGNFEKGRGWYHGPGVTTFAAAQRFLSQLEPALTTIGQIPLVEGFLSYKTTKTSHTDDAYRLITEFKSAECFSPCKGSQAILATIDSPPQIRRYNPPPSSKT